MKKPLDNRRHLEFDSKRKIILLTVFSFLCVAAGLFIAGDDERVIKWLVIIFFSFCGIFLLYRLLNPKTIFVKDEPERYQQFLEEERIATEQDPGLFTYSQHGFVLQDNERHIVCNWADIQTVFGYLKELDGEEELMLDIFTSTETKFTVGELTKGWFEFNKRLRQVYPFARRNWEDEVLDPDLHEKRKLVFDQKHRTQQQAEADCYKS
jgi:Ca2+/Na+ antiporter